MDSEKAVVDWQFVRIAGILGIVAAVANGVGDIFYQAVADGVYEPNMAFMWKVPLSHLRIGAYSGLLVIPLLLAAYWHVYHGIRTAGRWLALPPFFLAMYTVPIGCAVHFGLFYPAMIGHQIAGSSGDVQHVLTMLHATLNKANGVLFTVYSLGVALFSIWLMVLVLWGRTRYPRWFGLLNPLFLTIAYTLLVPLIPKYGAYLYPASALSDAFFFLISTWLLWNPET